MTGIGAGTAGPAGTNGDFGSAAPVAEALEAALAARAAGVHASTGMVRQLAVNVCRQLELDDRAQALVDVCVRVRDVGMVALPDSVVLATGPLGPEDWEVLNRHPVLGAELLETLPAMESAASIVRAHHERWDGQGYPDGLSGEAIPLLGRVIAACDAFVAMAIDRPHRRGIGAEGALEQVRQQSGSQFDPRAVDGLVVAITGGRSESGPVGGTSGPQSVDPPATARRGTRSGPRELRNAIAGFVVVPTFGPAAERVLAATAGDGDSARHELVATIESDIGLTIAVLRRAQAVPSRRPISNVVDAVAALTLSEIEEAVRALPRASFPWRTTTEALIHHARVHAQAAARAADRIAREVRLQNTDDLLVAAHVHDIGQLALASVRPGYGGAKDPRTTTPEDRVRAERRALGIDHASLGALALTKWGLPARLAATVAAHHTATAEDEPATLVRLADMVAHYANGDAVDRKVMLRLASVSGLSVSALRDVLFELPHSGGSQRRRAEPSPLSTRETGVLRLLAEAKVYKEIAADLGLSVSTVRTHLHNIYTKLHVVNAAQAVLRATERGWI
jgi:response regulator RpfG family c-di-GMP phosphodiesterase/DNA-binding CsgD family transcriptional regulator